MSWLYSQALVAAYSGAICLDGEPSAQSSGSPTQLAYLPPDRMTAFSRLSRFGMMFRPLTDDLGQAVLMSYLEDFPAKTFPAQARAQGSTESDPVCGDIWPGSFARYDRALSSWKTHQCSLLGDLDEFSETWPTWGLMHGGVCWEQRTLERLTNETAFGSSQKVPTPVASDYKRAIITKKYATKQNAPDDLCKWALRESGLENGRMEPQLWEWLMGWPIGHTDLKPQGTARFQQWQQQHSTF